METQVNLWNQELPSIKPFYAIKCNPNPTILNWLSYSNVGFDCASFKEILSVPHLSPVIYANPCKREEDITNRSDVRLTVVDSEEEVEKLQRAGWDGFSLVRIRVEDSGSLMRFSAKFGAALGDVEAIAKKAMHLGQKLSGISFHVGSGCNDPIQYRHAIHDSIRANSILRKTGHRNASVIDIGGGFSADKTAFQAAASEIRTASFTNNHPDHVYIAEPGRFFAKQAQDLFVKVIGKKRGVAPGSWSYTLDESVYGQFSCIPYDHGKPRWIRVRGEGEAMRDCVKGVLFGRTCDSVDMIAASESMERLEIGDWLWFPHMGAYTSVTATEFNGFPKPAEVLLYPGEDGTQLPDPADFSASVWPSDVRYVNTVAVP